MSDINNPNTNPNIDPNNEPENQTEQDGVIGTPNEDAEFWEGQQMYSDDCAIKCQEIILEQFTGQEFDENDLVQEAYSNGWYNPGGGGTPIEDVGNILTAHGVDVNRYDSATPYDLAKELGEGHKVIIGVDSKELWGQENPILSSLDNDADHAVIVSGIDTSDPENVQVIVSDPGTGEIATYPYDEFVAAWQDSNFFMVATDDPAPSTLPEMSNFDYELGHVDEIGGVTWDEFTAMQDNPSAFNELLEQWNSANLDETEVIEDDDYSDVIEEESGLDGIDVDELEVTYDDEADTATIEMSADMNADELSGFVADISANGVDVTELDITQNESGDFHVDFKGDIVIPNDETTDGDTTSYPEENPEE